MNTKLVVGIYAVYSARAKNNVLMKRAILFETPADEIIFNAYGESFVIHTYNSAIVHTIYYIHAVVRCTLYT